MVTVERRDPDGAVQGSHAPRRVLVLARNYPNAEMPLLGLWTKGLTDCIGGLAEARVVAPVPYAPPLPDAAALGYYRRMRRIPKRSQLDGEQVLHPRMLVGPGGSTQHVEAASYAAAVLPAVRRLRRTFRFDLIHAHFTYPDGVAACLLGRAFGVPIVISEHAPWIPWMEQQPVVRRQALWAASRCSALLPVSRYVRDTIDQVAGRPVASEPVPLAVDGDVFRIGSRPRRKGQILFVGSIRHAKGADVLIDALAILANRRAPVRLVMVGESLYSAHERELESLRRRIASLGVEGLVEMTGALAPADVAARMAESAVLVAPGRAESFGAVLIEALTCGTPVVATRCGGPEDVVVPEVGELVAPEDPAALADAIERVVSANGPYPRQALREYALRHFGVASVAARLGAHYERVAVNGGARAWETTR